MTYNFSRLKLRSPQLLLWFFLLVALVLRIDASVRYHDLVHPDEIFQTQEPAHRLAYGYGVVTWEWRRGVRSWIFPVFLAGVMRASDWLSAGSAGYRLGVAIALSLISLTTVWFGFAWTKRASGMESAICAAGVGVFWYELVHFGHRALTEVVAAHILLPGLYLGVYGEGLPERKRVFLAGLFCGLAVSLRVQLAPTVCFAALYFCYPSWRKRLPAIVAGLSLPLVIFGLVDLLTWSYPFQSFFRYFWVNVVEGRSVLYGAQPWYWYLVILAGHLGPLAILALLGVRRSPFLGWVAFIMLLSHSVFAHKEVRFIYPLVPIMLTLAGLGILEIAAGFNASGKSPLLFSKAVVVMGLVFCALVSNYLRKQFTYWAEESGNLIAFDQLSRDPTVCGVGVYGVSWFDTAGYTHLHRNVPVVLLADVSAFRKEAESFNALLTDGAYPLSGFALVNCWNGVCLYTRPGSCIPPRPGNEINAVLQRTGN